jgi:hypothetical protein
MWHWQFLEIVCVDFTFDFIQFALILSGFFNQRKWIENRWAIWICYKVF